MRLVYGWAPDSRLASSGEGSGPPAVREPSAEPWEKGEERRRRRGRRGARGTGGGGEGEGDNSSSHSSTDVVTKLTIMFCGRG